MIYREFWECGLRVFGIYGADKNGACACGWEHCPPASMMKHPRISNWQHTPHWSEEQIDAMADSDQFATGYGVLCNSLIVVDVDARNGGVDSFAKLVEAIPEISGAGLIVETGSGGGSRHLYFRAPEGVALVSHHADYPGCDFKSSGYVIGPGSIHATGKKYTWHGTPDDIEEAPAALVDLLRKPERHRAEYEGRAVDVSHKDLAEMLAHIDPDCDYETWIRCGMAMHEASDGTAFEAWDAWSQNGTKYPSKGQGLDSHWHSFGRSANPVTIGTLIHYAEQGGWKMPVEFTPDETASFPEYEEVQQRADGLPFDISGVDLKAPPGFTGELARWIEGQSRRPRENLAVAAALSGLGNVAGLRYTDDKDGVTCNTFMFCVAGSRTGKEAVQQAQAEIHRAAGIAPATHGAIKSEQEITRNLVRHQAAFYIVDEIGIFLQKIKNAQAKGGAAYLDGVIGMLMSAYSKADGFMLLTGDMKEDIRAILSKESAQIQKRMDENTPRHGDENRLLAVTHAMDNLDKGLERPFLSLIGYTTPVTFDELVDFNSATNGFIGRALIFNERDTAPRSKRRFRKADMSDKMQNALAQIYMAGEYDMSAAARVEYYGKRRKVPTADDALDMLDAALEWFEDQAVSHKGQTGLEALWLGAYELVSKVSLVLAVPSGLRTSEHVRWAYALIKRDVEDKMRLVVANDRQKDAPKLALAARIANIIAVGKGETGETVGVIYNRLRSHRRPDVDKTLAQMVQKGLVSKKDVSAKNGHKTTLYSLNG